MRALIAVVAVTAAAAALLAVSALDGGEREEPAFHVILAGTDDYEGGLYTETVVLEAGTYMLGFTPNGDSPEVLTVAISGMPARDFSLRGTLHQTGISEYYTWEYDGQKEVVVPAGGPATITIDPHGDLLGPVSVRLEG